MYPQQIHGYLLQFFKENNCEILTEHDHSFNVQLTIEMDKRIMNRPFYWKYLESAGGVPSPAQITFITDKNKLGEDMKGEVVDFGSPRLSQLFQVTKELGSFVQMYERTSGMPGPAIIQGRMRMDVSDLAPIQKTILTPWLGVNYKISYYSDQTKEMLYSLGINLMTGNLIEAFQESLSAVDLETTMSENTFNLPYTIKPIRALERLDLWIENVIKQDDHSWAEEAKMKWRKDQEVLDHFYEELENKPECYEMEKQAMEEQYATRIKIEIVNGGLFYLK